MFDHVVILDEPLACPVGHSLAGLQTKSFADPSMSTYLIRQDRVFRCYAATSRGKRSRDGLSGLQPTANLARARFEGPAVSRLAGRVSR
jgi:hypothetical protein